MKKTFTILLLLFTSFNVLTAQDFAGYRTGIYTGVNGVFFNPASIAGSPYKFDINLVTLNAIVANDQAAFKLKNLGDSNFSDQIFGDNARNANGIANIAAVAPSFMLNLNPNTTLAITARARVLANINDVNGKLIKKITEQFSNDPDLPYTLASQDNMLMNVSGWSEFGASVAHVLSDKNGNKFKGGLTVKYLAGSANAYINVNKLNGTMDADFAAQDAYLANTTGTMGISFSGVNIANFKAGDLAKFNGSGIGADLGFVYEWTKPEKVVRDSTNYKPKKHPKKGYTLRLGASILDIGSIGFTRDIQRSSGYNIQINGAERYYFSNFDGLEIDNIKQKFDTQPQYFTPIASASAGKYSLSLPSTLQLDADYQFASMLYLNASGQVALSSNKTKTYNAKVYSGVTLTPRFETSAFGVFIPINYNELTDFNLGVGFRAGPLIVGSGSVGSAVTGQSRQADLYFGLHFGMLKHEGKVRKNRTGDDIP